MARVRVHNFTISLDGYGASPRQTREEPLGVGGGALHEWFIPTRAFQRINGKSGGTTGVDDDIAARFGQGIGAWIMGRNMFGPIRGPWPDDAWRGWWGKNPPYHGPGFVSTHHARPPIQMEGGTSTNVAGAHLNPSPHLTDASSAMSLPETEIRRLVAEIGADSPAAADAWEALRPLGAAVAPYLADAYTRAKRWRGRVALVFHAIGYARASEAAFQLGLQALGDRSYMVRYRACMVLAYALRPEALAALGAAAKHEDERTAEDARAAIDAIEHRNHHYFVDRDHSGRSYWEVNPGDTPHT